MRITMETTLAEILKQPQLAGREYMVDPCVDMLLKDLMGTAYGSLLHGGNFAQLQLKQIREILPAWNVSSIRTGLQFLLEKVATKDLFHDIWDEREVKEDFTRKNTGLAAFVLPGRKKFAIICPGGGYASVCSIAEGYPLAMKMNEMGYSAFILQYRFGKAARWSNPMDDLAQAVRYIHAHAEELQVDVKDYLLTGFSAGGHLAASFGTESLGYAHYYLPKPGVIFLGYPVITMGEKTHAGSREMLLGAENADDTKLQEKFSIDKQVTADYPATYIWQCEADDTVPIENSKMFVEALRKNHIPYEYEVFPGSDHGWGLGTGTAADGWLERAVSFYEKNR